MRPKEDRSVCWGCGGTEGELISSALSAPPTSDYATSCQAACRALGGEGRQAQQGEHGPIPAISGRPEHDRFRHGVIPSLCPVQPGEVCRVLPGDPEGALSC